MIFQTKQRKSGERTPAEKFRWPAWPAAIWLALCCIFTVIIFLQKTETFQTEDYGLETDRTLTVAAGSQLRADFTLTGASFQGLSVKFQADSVFQSEILVARMYDADTGELLAEAETELACEMIRNKDYGSTIWFSLLVENSAGRSVSVVFTLEGGTIETEPKLVVSDSCLLESALYLDGEAQEGNLVFETRYSLGEQFDYSVPGKGAAAAIAGLVVLWLLRSDIFCRRDPGCACGKTENAEMLREECPEAERAVRRQADSGEAERAVREHVGGGEAERAGRRQASSGEAERAGRLCAGYAEPENAENAGREAAETGQAGINPGMSTGSWRKWAGLALMILALLGLFLLVYRYYVQKAMRTQADAFENVSFLPELYFPLCVLLLLFAVLLYLCCFVRQTKPLRLFLLSGLFLGLSFTLVICLNTVPDEPSHIDSAYQLSNELLGIPDSEKPGYIYKRACDVDSYPEAKKSLSVSSYEILWRTLFEGTGGNTELVECAASSNFSNAGRLFYLPQAIGLCIGRLLNLGTTATYLLARICALLVYLLLTCAALRAMPFAKTSLLLIALLPISLQQAASFSYDSVLNALAFLYVGYSLRLAYREDGTTPGVLAVLTVSGSLLAQAKGGVYLPLALLPVLLTLHRGRNFRRMLLFPAIPILAFLGRNLSSTLSRLTAAQGTLTGGAGSSEIYTLSYLLGHPLRLAGIALNTFYRQADSWLRNLLGGNLAWREVNINWCVVCGFLLLLLLSCLRAAKPGQEAAPAESRSAGCPGRKQELSLPEKLWVGLICAGCFGLIACSMLLSWTPVTYDYITGVQGRYFLPFFVLVLVLLRGSFISIRRNVDRELIFAEGILNIVTIMQVLQYVMK